MATIMELLQEADFNLSQNKTLNKALARVQLNAAVVLLNKGYVLNDDIFEILKGSYDIATVPEKENNQWKQ